MQSTSSRNMPGGARAPSDGKVDEAPKGTFPASVAFDLTTNEDAGNANAYASPPCFMHELDPSYLGYLSTSETVALLNHLLEGERAGARAAAEMARQGADESDRVTLRGIAQDEGRFCAMLARHITRLGETPSLQTGAFYGKLIALDSSGERIDLLNRGQAWVVRKLQEPLPRIGDTELHRDLKKMLEVHERNIHQCAEMAGEARGNP